MSCLWKDVLVCHLKGLFCPVSSFCMLKSGSGQDLTFWMSFRIHQPLSLKLHGPMKTINLFTVVVWTWCGMLYIIFFRGVQILLLSPSAWGCQAPHHLIFLSWHLCFWAQTLQLVGLDFTFKGRFALVLRLHVAVITASH